MSGQTPNSLLWNLWQSVSPVILVDIEQASSAALCIVQVWSLYWPHLNTEFGKAELWSKSLRLPIQYLYLDKWNGVCPFKIGPLRCKFPYWDSFLWKGVFVSNKMLPLNSHLKECSSLRGLTVRPRTALSHRILSLQSNAKPLTRTAVARTGGGGILNSFLQRNKGNANPEVKPHKYIFQSNGTKDDAKAESKTQVAKRCAFIFVVTSGLSTWKKP